MPGRDHDRARILTDVSVGSSHRTLREVVADEIRLMIMSARSRPVSACSRIASPSSSASRVTRSARRCGRSRAPDLVEVVPRRGAYVSRLEPHRARQLLELRSLLEAYAAEQAAAHRTDDDLAAMRKCLDEGRSATAEGDMVRAASCHRQFHILIEHAAQNEFLENAVAPLRHQTELVFSTLADTRGVTSWEEHARILDAIERGDPEQAHELAVSHMQSVAHDLSARQPAGDPPE